MWLAKLRDFSIVLASLFLINAINPIDFLLAEPLINLPAPPLIENRVVEGSVCGHYLTRDLAFQILDSSVRVQTPGGSGSGVLLWSGVSAIDSSTYYSYVITNRHVVRDESVPIIIEKFEYLNQRQISSMVTYTGKVIAISDFPDLALVEIKSEKLISGAGHLNIGTTYDAVKLYDTIFTAGCPLGNNPFITQGHIVEINEGAIFSTAFAIFGNSGGGNYLSDGSMVGISSIIMQIMTSEKATPIPIGDYAVLIPSNVVADWIDLKGFGFVLGETYGSLDDLLIERRVEKLLKYHK